uniref:Uncharacterized protein n=1 Tax=Arundo donax TaxID=35708 RepID=A0A0A9A134_ARUDO
MEAASCRRCPIASPSRRRQGADHSREGAER